MTHEILSDGFIRRKEAAPEKTSEDELRSAYDSATSSQSVFPTGLDIEQPVGVLYYSPINIEQIQAVRDRLASFASSNELTEFRSYNGTKIITVGDALRQIDVNLEFSRKVHGLLANRPARQESPNTKALILKKLLKRE
jgi:hypothetical protein